MDALRETIGAADDASTLPLAGERTARHVQGRVAVQSVRSGPSGSEGMGSGYARGRVAVRSGLPNGRERTKSVRSGPSGSAIGTLRAEWQCDSHCHSTVNVLRITFKAEWQRNRYVRCRVAVKGWGLGTLGAEWQCGRDCQTGVSVPNRYDRCRVAVKGWGLGTLGAEWQCISHCHSLVNVPHVAFKAEWQRNRYARGRVAVKGWGLGTPGAEWQCYSHCHSPVNVLCSASHTATRR